jgi:hypothetical protein
LDSEIFSIEKRRNSMFRDLSVRVLTSLHTGKIVGYSLNVGCMTFYVENEAELKKELVAIANDPQGHEEAFYLRKEDYDRRQRQNASKAEDKAGQPTGIPVPPAEPQYRRYNEVSLSAPERAY